jgi:hypothetical protein
MSLVEHAKVELVAAGYSPDGPEDNPSRWIYDNAMELITAFANQGHSGSSAAEVAGIFGKLARYQPLIPLQGTDDEWVEVGTNVWQNRRCSHVFKEADGKAYDINGRVFREPDGSCFTNRGSRVPIEFPYTPKIEYVDVPQA